MNRKSFLVQSAAGAALIVNPFAGFGRTKEETIPYGETMVKEFISAGHNNLDKVKEMVTEYPNLVYARHHLGGGDFEEAIEGAGHVGDKAIAKYLIEKGARANLFVMTMLGETALVRSAIEKYPSLLHAKGAHGFTLLHHATRGGEEGKELVDYLKSKALTEMRYKIS